MTTKPPIMGPDEIMALICALFPSPDFDDIASRVSRLASYAYTGDEEDLTALDAPDRAAIAAQDPPAFSHTGMLAHDGLEPHSHEVRPDHDGVRRAENAPAPADISFDEDSRWCQEHGHDGLLPGCPICERLAAGDPRFARLMTNARPALGEGGPES
jgi:hypothetical protein